MNTIPNSARPISRRVLIGAAASLAAPLAAAAVEAPGRLMVITGHLGNIGARLLPHYQPSWGIIGIDKKQGPEFDLSVRNPAWTRLLAGAEIVIHLAATANPAADAADIYQNNVLATCNLVEEAIKAGVRRVVFASSTNASPGRYGNPVGTYGPVTPYGASKLFGEALLENAVRENKLRCGSAVRVRWVPRPGTDTSNYPHWLQAMEWGDNAMQTHFDQAVTSVDGYSRIG